MAYRKFFLFWIAFALSACSASSVTTVSAPVVTATFTAAKNLNWTSQFGTTYILNLQPAWTLAAGETIASQSIRYYSDGTCTTPVGPSVSLTTNATTDNFLASDLTTYSFKVTSVSVSGVVATSACSSVVATNASACTDDRLTNAPYAGGTGTVPDPFLICTPAQMNAIGLQTGDYSKKFKLMTNLDLSAYTGTQFNMIGSAGTNFTGVFDGNNKTISNFSWTGSGIGQVGLFGQVSGISMVIKNLTLANVAVSASNANLNLGTLVGFHAGGTIQNCRVSSGTVEQTAAISNQYVGGAIGRSVGGIVTSVSSSTSITANNRAVGTGGVIGLIAVGTQATGLSYDGSFNASQNSTASGGIFGYLNSTTVTNSFFTGIVRSASGTSVGGIAGETIGSAELHTSYSSGAVSGDVTSLGGLIGSLTTTPGHGLFDNFSTATVTGNGTTSNVGGIAGSVTGGSPYIQNTYVAGVVSAGANVGAIAGSDPTTLATYTRNFWDNQINPALPAVAVGGAGTNAGVTTAAMKDPTTFSAVSWLGTEWNLTTSGVYLKLVWQP